MNGGQGVEVSKTLFYFRAKFILDTKPAVSLRLLAFVIYHGGQSVKKRKEHDYAKTMSGQLPQHIWHL